MVMRILAASKPIPLDEMGMSQRNLDEMRKLLAKPYGLVLCVGAHGIRQDHHAALRARQHQHR